MSWTYRLMIPMVRSMSARDIRSVPRRAFHPPLAHIPIGGVVIAAVCDVVSIAGGSSHVWARTWFKGGSYALIVGTAVLFLAVITGLVERSRRTAGGSADRRSVNRHAITMSLLGAVCVVDLIVRNNHYASARHTPGVVLALTIVALALAAVGGELGGRLVYRRGLGVSLPPMRDSHSALSAPTDGVDGTTARAGGESRAPQR